MALGSSRTASTPAPGSARRAIREGSSARRLGRRVGGLPLFWRVFLTNAAILGVATLVLALAPVTISVPIASAELVGLLVGLAVMLGLNLALLGRALRPLRSLTHTMRQIDPLAPGRRVEVPDADSDIRRLATAFNAMLGRLEDERRESASMALHVQESERQRIARELHDEVGQTLTAMLLQIESLYPEAPDELRGELDELRETARSGAEDVRRIAQRLRPEALEELGLQSALVALSDAFADQTGVHVDRRVEHDLPLSAQDELVIYRVAQEALTNIARHAGATRAELELASDAGGTALRVRDDGRGFDADRPGASFGVRGMRERAMLIGASLEIASRPGRGTDVVLRVQRNEAS
jgi:two-component system, NarL family, sensor histidine kinase UhpB